MGRETKTLLFDGLAPHKVMGLFTFGNPTKLTISNSPKSGEKVQIEGVQDHNLRKKPTVKHMFSTTVLHDGKKIPAQIILQLASDRAFGSIMFELNPDDDMSEAEE